MKSRIQTVMIILLLFCITGNSVEINEKEDTEKYFEMAINFLNNDDYKNADHYFSKVIESYNPIKDTKINNYFNVYALRALCRVELDKVELAIADYETFIKSKQNYLTPYIELQILYLKVNRLDKARQISEVAKVLFPNEFRLRYNVLQRETVYKNYNGVIEECLKILDDQYYKNLPKEKLECPPFEELLGYCYLKVGNIEKAKYYTKILIDNYRNPLSSVDLIRFLYIAEFPHIEDKKITDKMLNDYKNEL